MNAFKNSLWLIVERVLPSFVLIVMLLYTYAKFFEHPYGMRWRSSGEIVRVFEQQPEPTIKLGDRIVQIGPLRWDEFRADLRKTFFDGTTPGDIVPIIVERGGEIIHVSWTYPGFMNSEFLEQFYSEWAMAYVFWLAGLLTILFVRPKDDRWLLMALFNFLTALWLMAGSGVSAFHIWNSALVLRMAVWLCVPVYLHLHWVFPQPLGRLSPKLIWVVYGFTVALVVAQGFQLLPAGSYFLGFVTALLGSFILLIIHIVRQPIARNDLRFLFVSVLLAIVVAVMWQIIYNLNKMPLWFGSGGLLGLPLLPLAYLYSAFRRRLGDLEMRVNRFFSIYLFVILLGLIELPVLFTFSQMMQISGEVLIMSLLALLFTSAAFIWAYPVFERFIERRFFGIALPPKQLLEKYSTHITTSASIHGLTKILHEEILSSLIIRQFAFLLVDHDKFKLMSILNVQEDYLPNDGDMPDLQAHSESYLYPAFGLHPPLDWIRLILPLKLGDQTIGFWLLGRRDPDDLYSQAEIPILRSLANQTAVALSNILQTERLKSMYEANIGRYEYERKRLALDLHDSVLNGMASLLMNNDLSSLSPKFHEGYQDLIARLREIVSDLRPPMLKFGLKFALEDIADKLSERNQNIIADLQADAEPKYPEVVEHHIYRIVQESSENAAKYAKAKTIRILGKLQSDCIDITVIDDGLGFPSEVRLKLDEMVVNKHFGLAGILERANLIGAEIDIDSKPQQGTRIHVVWMAKDSI